MKTSDELFNSLSPEVRDFPWRCNDAGEIFVEDGTEQGRHIGHFPGNADLAAFVVAAQWHSRRGFQVAQKLRGELADLSTDPGRAASGSVFVHLSE